MSRIEEILAKAARDGQVRRTADVGNESAAAAPNPRPRFSAVPAPPTAHPSEPARPVEPPRHAMAAAVTAAARPRPTPLPYASPKAFQPETLAPPMLANPVLVPAQAVRALRPHPLLVAAVKPHSTAAEQYRAIRTRISQVEGERRCRTILVTSPLSSDGKTVTALNLALTMAQEFHRKVVAIDADLRNGSLYRLFGIPERPGLSDVLVGAVKLEDALVSLPDLRLTLLPAGSPAAQPTELLGSAEMRRLVDTLHTQFDRVVIDTPPASPLADVGVLSPLVDGVVLVVRAGRTPRPAIDRALGEFEPDRLLGLVLNDVEEPVMEIRP